MIWAPPEGLRKCRPPSTRAKGSHKTTLGTPRGTSPGPPRTRPCPPPPDPPFLLSPVVRRQQDGGFFKGPPYPGYPFLMLPELGSPYLANGALSPGGARTVSAPPDPPHLLRVLRPPLSLTVRPAGKRPPDAREIPQEIWFISCIFWFTLLLWGSGEFGGGPHSGGPAPKPDPELPLFSFKRVLKPLMGQHWPRGEK